jgi:alanine racemase
LEKGAVPFAHNCGIGLRRIVIQSATTAVASTSGERKESMIPVSLDQIAAAVRSTVSHKLPQCMIDRVSTDSRGVAPNTLFVALKGVHTDGHQFLADAFRNGAACAVISKGMRDQISNDPAWPLIVTDSPLSFLQQLAKWYRSHFINQVVAITGSNGKTVVKDSLGSLLASRGVTVSPGSYNSKLGLPLAVLSNEKEGPLAILEAGVSEPNEMEILEEIAAPNFGILTNIGVAHLASFGSRHAIAQEKMKLFRRIPSSGWVILPEGEDTIRPYADQLECQKYVIGATNQPLSLTVVASVDGGHVLALASAEGVRCELLVNTLSPDIISDLHIAATAAYLLGMKVDEIASTLEGYIPTPTRTEVWSSPHGVRIVSDAYTADPISVHNALRTAALGTLQTGRKIFAFAGMKELGTRDSVEQRQVGEHAAACGFSHLFLVGQGLNVVADSFRSTRPDGVVFNVRDTSDLKDHLLPFLRLGDTVLFKGPRNSGMVAAARDLAGSIAPRVQWIELAAIAENVARFRRYCGGRVKVMAVLKALAYGTEFDRLGFWFSKMGIHHVGVSTTSEGISVRRSGISQEIYVFLPNAADADNLARYRLTPILYDGHLVDQFIEDLRETRNTIDVHLKVNTGMNRLGVEPEEALSVARKIRESHTMRLVGVCTHFSSADDPAQDNRTRRQISVFNNVISNLEADGFRNLITHAANTAATVRFPDAHYDMVRVGLGLYGIYPSVAVADRLELELAIGVTSQIARIQHVKRGQSIGYGCAFTANKDMNVGTIPFGYDDGLKWEEVATGSVLINGKLAPIVGRVSMDQMQVDISDVGGVGIGSPVLIYGAHDGYVLRPEIVAKEHNTIPHEMLVDLGSRVTRIYVEP